MHLLFLLYKLTQLIISNQLETDINDDLFDGICIVKNSKTEENLENLLEQYREANCFRENKRAFYKEYQDTSSEEVSNNEKLFIHAFNHAYEEEKKLVKKYFINE